MAGLRYNLNKDIIILDYFVWEKIVKLLKNKALQHIATSILCGYLAFSFISYENTKYTIHETRNLLKIAQLLKEQKYVEAENTIALKLQGNILDMDSFVPDLTGKGYRTRPLIDEIASFYEKNGGLPECIYTQKAEEAITKARNKLNK